MINPASIIAFLWNNKTAILIVVAIGVFVFYVRLADKRGQERDELKDQLRGATDVISDMRAWHDETTAVLERKALNDTERTDFERETAIRNQADRVAGDGPLAPVLLNGLHKLSLRQAEREARNPR